MPRKTRTRLDKNAVVEAAVEILNTEGIGALSLSRLADELGIKTPSLYNHVNGLAGLQQELNAMNAKLLANCLSDAAMGKSGEELFIDAAQAFRAYVKEYPGLYMSTLRSSGDQQIQDESIQHEEERAMKVGLAIMASLGLQGEDAIHGLRAFRSMVHGFATLEVAGGFGLPQDCDESFRRLASALVAGLQKN
ncbi:MAG: WHG domain-containing protein [Anaerolineales bacterium]|nr:WHG domain-containing protein [Anaerolineales bacterium]